VWQEDAEAKSKGDQGGEVDTEEGEQLVDDLVWKQCC
jgi:hypothetical protein